MLLVLCLPPVLLAAWMGSIHHNWDRGIAAVRYAVACGPPGDRPLVLAGSAAGLVLVTAVAVMGGPGTLAEVFSQRWVWLVILLPEIAWLGPLAVAVVLLPLRRPIASLMPAPPRRRGAFE